MLTQHCCVVSSHVVLPHVSVVDVPPLLELPVEPLELPLLAAPLLPELVPPLPELPVPELVPPLPELVPPLPEEVAPLDAPPLVDPELVPLLVPEVVPPLLVPPELAPYSPGTSSSVLPPHPITASEPATNERDARRASFMGETLQLRDGASAGSAAVCTSSSSPRRVSPEHRLSVEK
jgi:hypothetical protein